MPLNLNVNVNLNLKNAITMSDNIITTGRRQEAHKITVRRTLYAAGAGLIPIPVVDAAAILGIQVLMIRDIGQVYGVEFREQRVKSLITSLVGDVAVVGLFKIVPGLGTFFGGASAAAAGAAATYALGEVFSQHFEEGGTLLDFDPARSREFFQKEFEKGKEVVANFKHKTSGKSAAPESNEAPVGNQELLEQSRALHAEVLALQQELEALRRKKYASPALPAEVDLNDLQLIEGIGPKVEAALKEAGITDLLHLASAKVETLKLILDKAEGNFNLAVPDTWPNQAGLAVRGDMEALKALQAELTGGRETKTSN